MDNPDDAVVEFNKRIAKICYAMKQGGVRGRDRVEVYTVIFGEVATSSSKEAADLRALYRDCASRDANFFLAPSNAELVRQRGDEAYAVFPAGKPVDEQPSSR